MCTVNLKIFKFKLYLCMEKWKIKIILGVIWTKGLKGKNKSNNSLRAYPDFDYSWEE